MASLIHQVEGNELRLAYDLAASGQAVWDAFSQQEAFCAWWGPRGWVTEVKEFSFLEGGVIHYGMKCEDPKQKDWFGKYSWGKMTLSSVVPIERFTYTDFFVDETGQVVAGMLVSDTLMQLETVETGIKLVSVTRYGSAQALSEVLAMGMLQGIGETYERLAEYLLAPQG